jgi:signal transduction histidine kinase
MISTLSLRPSCSRKEAEALGLAILLGLALELCPVEMLPGSYFSFGMSMALAVGAQLGPIPGLLALLAIKSIRSIEVGSALLYLPYGLEILAICLMRRRRPDARILVLDGIFWPLLGLPIFAAAYRLGLGVSAETVALILLKVWFVGLFNAFLAGLIVDSRAVCGFLGQGPAPRRNLAHFFNTRISLVILPLTLAGLCLVIGAYREQVERSLAIRVRAGLEAARLGLETGEPGESTESLAERLEARRVDPEGRYEALPSGLSLPGPEGQSWRDGLFVSFPPKSPHPTDRWRASKCFGVVGSGDRRLRYTLAFESAFIEIGHFSIAVLAFCLLVVYGSSGVMSLTARSIGRWMSLILSKARSVPERMEDEAEQPSSLSRIEEMAVLGEKFRAGSLSLLSLFKAIRDSRDELESAVEDRTEEVRLLLARVENEREEERTRVARELHDEMGQGLASLGMALYLLEKRVGGRDARADEKIADIRGLLSGLSESMRRLVAGLRPSVLDRIGLPEALASLAEERSKLSGIAIEASSSLPAGLALSEGLRSTAYRVAQEALSNAIKHSGSQRVWLRLRLEGGKLVLEVEDSGSGFDPSARRSGSPGIAPASFGIIGMRERCRALGGSLSISSAPGKGTRVRAVFPLTGELR